MLHRVRKALLWLSLLALPLQGMAGTLMPVCPPDGHHMVASSAQAGCCDELMPAGSMVSGGEAPEDIGSSSFACGTGSVCFTSVALPAVPLAVPDTGPALAPSSVLPSSPVGFFTDGPDRPPRPAFA